MSGGEGGGNVTLWDEGKKMRVKRQQYHLILCIGSPEEMRTKLNEKKISITEKENFHLLKIAANKRGNSTINLKLHLMESFSSEISHKFFIITRMREKLLSLH